MSRFQNNRHAPQNRSESDRVTRLFSGGRHRWNELGFLDVDQSPEVYRAEHLFQEPVALIIGAPWLGKTTTARQLRRWLDVQPPGLAFRGRLCLTEFGRYGAELTLPPTWWEQWEQASPASPACWIIDALDEGEERLGGIRERILQLITDLDGDHRGRLRLLILSRQREWLAVFRTSLGEAYDLGPMWEVPEFHLAPLHEDAAREMLAAYPGAFDHIADLIRRFDLRPLAGYPIALDYLRQQGPVGNLSVVMVWRDLLQHLLREPNSERQRRMHSEIDERFTAAARFAAVLTMTGSQQVVDHSLPPGLPVLADIFPLGGEPRLRQAAREACEVGPFLPTAEGGYRFAQRNVQDWLAAFGMAEMKLSQVQSALCDGEGRLSLRHGDLLPLLRQVSTDPEVHDWIDNLSGGLPLASDLVQPTLAGSLAYIDRLERNAADAMPGMWLSSEGLPRLAAPGLGNALAIRLRDPHRSATIKDLLLDIARVTDPYPALPAALDLVLDRHLPTALRRRALLLITHHGGDAHFRQLVNPVARAPGNGRAEQQLRATVIRHLLERRLWTVPEAAMHSPPAEPNVLDDRHLLLKLIQERMSADDARALLRDRQRINETPRLVLDPHRDLDLLEAALDRLLKEDRLDEADEKILIEAALEWREQRRGRDPIFAVLQRLGGSAPVRRRLYEHGIAARRRDPSYNWTWSFVLRLDDWSWLLEKARNDWADMPMVWEDLYRSARTAYEAGLVDQVAWKELNRLVERHAPGFQGRFDQNRAAFERSQLEHERQMQELERQRPAPATLREEVTALLAQDGWTADQSMRELSWLCFVPNLRPAHITGSWEELDAGLQSHVLATLREGLEQGTPTPVPESSTFPSDILSEAWAFLRVIDHPEEIGWLTADRVRRWLATAVFALHEQIPAIVRRCAEIDQPSTVGILLDAAERELLGGSRMAATAAQIPVEWWDDPMVATRATGWMHNGAIQAEARIDMLGLLAQRAPHNARLVAVAWSELPGDGSPTTETLRRAGLNFRLALDPEGAWPLIEEDYRRRGAELLRELSVFQQHGRHAIRIDLTGWPVSRLEALGRLLLREYPIHSDPERADRIIKVTPETQLRDTRDQLIWILFSRDDAEARNALERLAAPDVDLEKRIRDYRARQAAEGILAGITPQAAEAGSFVPLAEAIRLLDQAGYRLIRNAADLLEAVCEVLTLIERDIPEDLPMLYGKRPEKGAAPVRLNEQALQAYLRRRLMDLLPRRVQGFKRIEMLREDQVGYGRRLDLRVIASCLQTGELVTVIVEVKWSDNRETATSLTEQLGRKYLIGTGVRHGVYLVGWVGHWSYPSKGRSTDRDELVAHLNRQRDTFCAADPGKGLLIRPIVLDVRWRESVNAP